MQSFYSQCFPRPPSSWACSEASQECRLSLPLSYSPMFWITVSFEIFQRSSARDAEVESPRPFPFYLGLAVAWPTWTKKSPNSVKKLFSSCWFDQKGSLPSSWTISLPLSSQRSWVLLGHPGPLFNSQYQASTIPLQKNPRLLVFSYHRTSLQDTEKLSSTLPDHGAINGSHFVAEE